MVHAKKHPRDVEQEVKCETLAEMVVEKLLKSGALAEYLNEHLTETFLNGVEKMVMPRLFKELKQPQQAC